MPCVAIQELAKKHMICYIYDFLTRNSKLYGRSSIYGYCRTYSGRSPHIGIEVMMAKTYAAVCSYAKAFEQVYDMDVFQHRCYNDMSLDF